MPKTTRNAHISRHHYYGWAKRTYYQSPHWRAISDSFLARNPLCYGCDAPAQIVHHEAYTYGNLAGRDEEYLFSLCHKCHYHIHFHQSTPISGSLEIARRLRQRRKTMVINGWSPIYERAHTLHGELDERLAFLIHETD